MSDWMTDAACKDTDADIWFGADTSDRTVRHHQTEAKRICFTCPSLDPCLDYALDNNIKEGVWGGLNEDERRRMARGRRKEPPTAKCGTRSGYGKHLRAGEAACDDCRAANADYSRRRSA